MTRTRRLWFWGFGLAVFASALRSPSLNLLLDRDEGEYSTLAWLWRSGAGLPYRDWLEQKPPLAIVMNMLAQTCFGGGVLGLRLFSMLWIVLTVLAIFFLVEAMGRRGRLGWRLRFRPFAGEATAGLAAFMAAIFLSTSRTQSLAANTETWQTLPLLGALSLLFVVDPKNLKGRHFFVAGCCIGLAALFKQTAFAAILILPFAAQDADGKLLKSLGWTLMGALAPWFITWGCFQVRGAGPDFLMCTLAYNRNYVLQGISGELKRLLGLALWCAPELWAVVGLAVLGWHHLGQERAPRRWLAAWLMAAAIAFAASGRFYPHYAVLLLPPLAVLAGLGLSGLFPGGLGGTLRPFSRIMRAVLLVAAMGGYAWADGGLWLRPGDADRTMHVYGLATFVNAPQAARRVQQFCPSSQNLFIWGDEAELYYLAQRRPATRFLFTYPFTGEAPVWPDGEREMRAGLWDARTGAAVLCKNLDQSNPFQKGLFTDLTGQYQVVQGVPGFVLGARKR